MKFFKKRSVALILCVLVVLGSTVLNTRWKLGDDCEELDALFRSKDGIAVQLETLQEQADVLASVAEANEIDAAALRSASEEMLEALSQGSYGAAKLYRCYTRLRTELSNIRQALLSAQLSEQHSATANRSLEAIESAKTALSASEYNKQVDSFLSRNGSSFTRLLASIAGVRLPEVFA